MLEMNSGWNKEIKTEGTQWKCITAVRVSLLHVLCWEWTEIVLQNHNVPKIYMWTPGDASTRWSQRQADTFKQQAMKLISERRRNVRRTFFFLYSSKLSDIFFFPGATFFFSSLHKLFSGIFLHVIWTLSVKRGCSCFKTVKTFFLYLYFFLFFFTCETEWNQISERKLYFYIVLYLKQEHFFFDNDIFFQENFLKWIKNQVNFYLSMWN